MIKSEGLIYMVKNNGRMLDRYIYATHSHCWFNNVDFKRIHIYDTWWDYDYYRYA